MYKVRLHPPFFATTPILSSVYCMWGTVLATLYILFKSPQPPSTVTIIPILGKTRFMEFKWLKGTQLMSGWLIFTISNNVTQQLDSLDTQMLVNQKIRVFLYDRDSQIWLHVRITWGALYHTEIRPYPDQLSQFSWVTQELVYLKHLWDSNVQSRLRTDVLWWDFIVRHEDCLKQLNILDN